VPVVLVPLVICAGHLLHRAGLVVIPAAARQAAWLLQVAVAVELVRSTVMAVQAVSVARQDPPVTAVAVAVADSYTAEAPDQEHFLAEAEA
jgi:hypothetical protein